MGNWPKNYEKLLNKKNAGVKFKIVETGGSSIKSQLQKPNPTASQDVRNLTAYHAKMVEQPERTNANQT